MSFLQNARAVRHFHTGSPFMVANLSPSAERVVLTTRKDGPFFPNIRQLTMASRAFGRLVMTETVRRLNWHIDERGTSAADLSSTCGAIVERMPGIKTLSLHFRDVTLLTEPLGMLFSRLVRLEEVALPLYCLTPSLMEVLASLPSLRNISMTEISNKSVHLFPTTLQLQEFRRHEIQFPYGSFPELQGLSFSCPSIALASQILSANHFPLVSITRLFIRIPHIIGIDRDHVRDVLSSICSNALRMEDLTLWLTQSGRHTPPMMITGERLSLADIIAITNCKDLKSFTIVHPLPLHLNDDDMKRLASYLPRIQRLLLNQHPALLRPTDVTVRSLQYFAKLCPEMQELGIFLDGMVVVEPGVDSTNFPAHFRKLFLGRSRLPGVQDASIVRSLARSLVCTFSPWVSILSPVADDTLDTKDYVHTRQEDAVVQCQSRVLRLTDERLQSILMVAQSLRKYRAKLMLEKDRLHNRLETLRSQVYGL